MAFGHILRLGIAEGPYLVTLDALTGEVSERGVLVFGTSLADVHQEFGHRVLGNSRHPNRGADAVAFYKTADHLGAFD
jgi:hypothetical protein